MRPDSATTLAATFQDHQFPQSENERSVFMKGPLLQPPMRPELKPPLRPLTDEESEVRELTQEDLQDMRPVREVHPELVEAMKEFRERNKGGRRLRRQRFTSDSVSRRTL
jgi:hypothetical protein